MFGRRGTRRRPVDAAAQSQQRRAARRQNVLGLMPTIRIMLRRYGCDVDHYSDKQIADVLVEAAADATRVGLSPWHLSAAAQRLEEQRPLTRGQGPDATGPEPNIHGNR